MRVDKLDLNLLYALEILLEEKSITRTAHRLNLSQSAVSSILSRLRHYFEDDLLVQFGKKMEPTPYALELALPIKQVMNLVRTFITSKRQNNPENSKRHFRIIASDYIAQLLLSTTFNQLQLLAPTISFEFLTPFSFGADSLNKGNADIFIAPKSKLDTAFPSQFLIADELICLGDSNIYAKQDSLTTEQFFEVGHITVGYERISQFSIESWFEENCGQKRKIDVITNDFNTLCLAARNTSRVALVPSNIAAEPLKSGQLKVLKIPFNLPRLEEHMTWHPTQNRDPIHQWLRQQIKSNISTPC
ncbi:MAG: LysR family transcriptional regulator [Gammaproteobacteria bacterium]|nr:LysR family transcriptional regulator [Gammaproteobacteria bacterium]